MLLGWLLAAAAVGAVAAPVTLPALVASAAAGSEAATTALDFINTKTSDHDDLYIKFNGKKVWPTGKFCKGKIIIERYCIEYRYFFKKRHLKIVT